jgi:hypothetical protein
MDDESRIATVSQYLRRKYQNNVAGLKALAASIAESAFEAVTITGHAAEGASVQGQLTFEPIAYLACVEALILEMDPDNTPEAPSDASVINFGTRYHTT